MSQPTVVYYVHTSFSGSGYAIVRDVISSDTMRSYVIEYDSLSTVLSAAATVASGGDIGGGTLRGQVSEDPSSWGALFTMRADHSGVWHCFT